MAGSVPSAYGGDDDAGVMSDINVTPLVDVVLVLLIVFMITVPAMMAMAPLKADLPQTAAVEVSSERLPLLLALRRGEDGGVVLYAGERAIDKEGLAAMLQDEMFQPLSEQRASLAADQGIPYGEVVTVLDMLASMGVTKISLDTKHVKR